MTDFEQSYIDLLIKQYWQQDKAPQEIRLQAGTWKNTVDWLRSFLTEFDLDNATGDRLDIIGRIIGLKRIVPFVVPKIAFGFDENPNARGFDDKFISLADRAPFADKFARQYTSLQLDDTAYRFFLRAKISKNIGSPYLADDSGLSIQDATSSLFDGRAYAIDKQNMTLALYVSPSYNLDNLRAIIRLDLLPKPHGVAWKYIVQAAPGETFGFADNPDALPWGDKASDFTPTWYRLGFKPGDYVSGTATCRVGWPNVYSTKDISADGVFTDPISLYGEFNVSISGEFAGTVALQRRFGDTGDWLYVNSWTEPVELWDYEPGPSFDVEDQTGGRFAEKIIL